MEIRVFTAQVSKEDILTLAKSSFGVMVKGVIDIQQEILALGGELHADAEQILLNQGSRQENLWGFNIYLQKSKDEYLEYSSMINIRPKQGNRGREIADLNLRMRIKEIIDTRVEL